MLDVIGFRGSVREVLFRGILSMNLRVGLGSVAVPAAPVGVSPTGSTRCTAMSVRRDAEHRGPEARAPDLLVGSWPRFTSGFRRCSLPMNPRTECGCPRPQQLRLEDTFGISRSYGPTRRCCDRERSHSGWTHFAQGRDAQSETRGASLSMNRPVATPVQACGWFAKQVLPAGSRRHLRFRGARREVLFRRNLSPPRRHPTILAKKIPRYVQRAQGRA